MLPTNSLAFIALCNEYCHAAENAREADKAGFVDSMLRLLPRIYISATDLKTDPDSVGEDFYLENALEEEYYESVRRSIENLLGEDDTYLEVFEEDMKYSDSPIAASIAEGLADIFQSLYNLTEVVRDAPEDLANAALAAAKDDFATYWSRTLCNVLRAINHIRYFSESM